MHKLKIDIVSDVVCPWCVIGFKNLQKAMTELQKEIEFEINHSQKPTPSRKEMIDLVVKAEPGSKSQLVILMM